MCDEEGMATDEVYRGGGATGEGEMRGQGYGLWAKRWQHRFNVDSRYETFVANGESFKHISRTAVEHF